MDLALCLSLVGVVIVSLSMRAYRPCAAATALLSNLLLCTYASDVIDNGLNYMLLASADLITAVIILLLPQSRETTLLASTYVFGLCCHAAFAWIGAPKDAEDAYWLALYLMAWGQLCITVVWTVSELVGMVSRGSNPWRWLHIGRNLSGQMDKHGAKK